MADTITPGLPGGPTFQQPHTVEGATPTPFQLGTDADGRPVALVRWTFTAAERAAIGAGADVFALLWVDERVLWPPMAMRVGDARQSKMVAPSDELPRTPPLPGTADVEGGPLDGEVMTASRVLELMGEGKLVGYTICKVENFQDVQSTDDRPTEHFRLIHRDQLTLDGIDVPDEIEDGPDDDDDEGDEWKSRSG